MIQNPVWGCVSKLNIGLVLEEIGVTAQRFSDGYGRRATTLQQDLTVNRLPNWLPGWHKSLVHALRPVARRSWACSGRCDGIDGVAPELTQYVAGDVYGISQPSVSDSRIYRRLLPILEQVTCLHTPGELADLAKGRMVLVDGTDVPTRLLCL